MKIEVLKRACKLQNGVFWFNNVKYMQGVDIFPSINKDESYDIICKVDENKEIKEIRIIF